LPKDVSVLEHPLGQQLIGWYKNKHDIQIDNTPKNSSSRLALEQLVNEILLPIAKEFGKLQTTYGFTSPALQRYIKLHSPSGTAPDIDQHSASELNLNAKPICNRGGAACDIIVETQSMANIVRFIVKNLRYDRIYYYGSHRPMHVSCNEIPNAHLQIMKESKNGKRYPAKKAFGEATIKLSESL
jgi:hypothetical protein